MCSVRLLQALHLPAAGLLFSLQLVPVLAALQLEDSLRQHLVIIQGVVDVGTDADVERGVDGLNRDFHPELRVQQVL